MTNELKPCPLPKVKPLDVGQLATLMMATWQRTDPNSKVARHMTSYVATFADMARDVLSALELPSVEPKPLGDE